MACLASNCVYAQALTKQEFVGSTPCDSLSREFLGGIPTDAPCHCIGWHLTLMDAKNTGEPRKYSLVVRYGIPGRDDPNQLVEGPSVKLEGTFDVVRGSKTNARAMVYRIHDAKSGKSLSLVRISDHLIHFLNDDKTLKVGNAGWSYTLNRKSADQAH
jgi:hypothetical protein